MRIKWAKFSAKESLREGGKRRFAAVVSRLLKLSLCVPLPQGVGYLCKQARPHYSPARAPSESAAAAASRSVPALAARVCEEADDGVCDPALILCVLLRDPGAVPRLASGEVQRVTCGVCGDATRTTVRLRRADPCASAAAGRRQVTARKTRLHCECCRVSRSAA